MYILKLSTGCFMTKSKCKNFNNSWCIAFKFSFLSNPGRNQLEKRSYFFSSHSDLCKCLFLPASSAKYMAKIYNCIYTYLTITIKTCTDSTWFGCFSI